MVVNYNNPATVSLVIDSVSLGGTPPVLREVIVLGDPVTSANKAKVSANGQLGVRGDAVTAAGQALTPFYMQGAASTRFVVKASPGSLYGITVINQMTTTRTTAMLVNYMHFFDTNTLVGFGAGSLAFWKFAIPVMADKQNVIGTGAGLCDLSGEHYALASFANGITIVASNVSNSTTTNSGIAVPIGVIWIL